MARIPMVTRTITTTHANALCLDISSGEPCNMECVLPRTYKDEASMLKAAKGALETDTLKVVHIVDSRECETLYGMSEQKFIENARVLPPRTKENDSEETDETYKEN